jgi:hypothetical protein
MKACFPYRILLMLFFFGLLHTTHLQAQMIRFSYGPGNSFHGAFKVDADYVVGDNTGELFNINEALNIKSHGANKARVRFAFTNKGIDLNRRYKIVLRTACYASGTMEIKPLQQKEIELRSNGTTSERLEFEVTKNGTGELVIGYDVTKDGEETNKCSHEIIIPYKISGIPELEKEACQRALSAFNTNKMYGVPQLEAVLKTYSNPPCKDEIDDILAQYNLYKKAKNLETSDCEEAKRVCAAYMAKYRVGGKFTTEMILINNCRPIKKTKPINTSTTTVDPVSLELKDWKAIQASKNPQDFIAYIEKYPGGKFTEQASTILARLSPIEVQETRVSDSQRSFKLQNADKPRIKNMSLTNGLNIDASNLATSNQFDVTLDQPGEYAVRIIDAMGKDTTIRISSAFDASMTALPDGSGYFIKIGGGQRPYVVLLEDLNTNKQNIFRGSINTDTTTITMAELNKRKMKGQFSVKVKGTGATALLELGSITNKPPRLDPVNTILSLVGALILLLGVYFVLVVLRNRKRSRRKKTNTIYDHVNY